MHNDTACLWHRACRPGTSTIRIQQIFGSIWLRRTEYRKLCALTQFHPFAVEQFLSEMEHGVEFNFSESGVHPMRYEELFALAQIDTAALFETLVDYPQVNGFTSLRQKIAALYPEATPDNILVTVGATEANTLIANSLLQPGDNIVRFRPTYEQLAGNAANLGIEVRNVDMVEAQD